jgi:RHS repeat-associated protein
MTASFLKASALFEQPNKVQNVRVYNAEDHMDYVTGQWLDTGDTTAMALHDFNGNGLSDLITINRFGTVQFFKNMAGTGLVEVGSPIQAHGAGPLKVMDVLHNHQRDLIVEVAPGIEQVIDVGDIFGPQPIITTGKRVIRYAFFDHLGSTRMLTDDYGDVVWPSMGGEPNKLSPFGKDVAYSDGDIVRESYLLNFTNKEIDYNLDLHYFGARYYTADFPRFVSPDPVSGRLTNPISWNRYLYCANDPINYIDPDGRQRTRNQTDYTIWAKCEDSCDVFPIYGGQFTKRKIDGIADARNHPGTVFKVVNGVNVTVKGDGDVSTSHWLLPFRLIQRLRGGRKTSEWNQKLNEDEPPDPTWNKLFEKANDPSSADAEDPKTEAADDIDSERGKDNAYQKPEDTNK